MNEIFYIYFSEMRLCVYYKLKKYSIFLEKFEIIVIFLKRHEENSYQMLNVFGNSEISP